MLSNPAETFNLRLHTVALSECLFCQFQVLCMKFQLGTKIDLLMENDKINIITTNDLNVEIMVII